MSDDLERFVEAQDPVYDGVCVELREGEKRTHWMWFVFPILTGLANSPNARTYAISSVEEARAYMAHPVLGERLRKCVKLVVDVDGKTAREILGEPDDWKLWQCLTLFAVAVPGEAMFAKGLERFFDGRQAGHTLERLKELESGGQA